MTTIDTFSSPAASSTSAMMDLPTLISTSTLANLYSDTFSSTLSDVLPALAPTIAPTSAPPRRHLNSVVSFIIGFAIILGASLLNASGLNLTKLDHVRTSAIPKAARAKDWLRPLWLLGMLLYIISQLIGSTLALEYMRAEYVAPLGSSSLIFNFLFASFLLGTPVTKADVYGTLVIVLGVVGIVAFGSVNSGIDNGMSLNRLISLWSRGGWLLFFIFMSISILVTFHVVNTLDAILVARSDVSDEPPIAALPANASFILRLKHKWDQRNRQLRDRLNEKTAFKSNKQLAWTLGVGWSCCGGLLAGGCLVFAKACVKLISGSLSHENEGNQFVHPAVVVTVICLALTAIMQIVCLNRGLKVYDSTLVVPVFYGIYTASGFLNSLIFNDEVDAYQSWTLFLVGVSIAILIGGVVLLTNKKPPPPPATGPNGLPMPSLPLYTSRGTRSRTQLSNNGKSGSFNDGEDEFDALNIDAREEPALWELGELSDEDGGPEEVKASTHTAIGSGGDERSQLIIDEDGEEGQRTLR